LEISFTSEGSKTFADATEKAVGHKMATVIDGEITSAPVINSKIGGGKAMITFTDAAEAAALAKKLGC
jgi:preprotein translocase subunit SecD